MADEDDCPVFDLYNEKRLGALLREEKYLILHHLKGDFFLFPFIQLELKNKSFTKKNTKKRGHCRAVRLPPPNGLDSLCFFSN